MSFDGIFLNCIKNDLSNKLIGGRVDKIYQPDKNEIFLSIRNGGENYKLMMSISSSSPRCSLTNLNRKNPDTPPMFCMLLRKHLTSSRIIDIKQHNFDRILEIVFECKDELDTTVNKSIVIEIMGKHSNIIFYNTQDFTVIDSIKRVAENTSSVRQIYPGLKYVAPPSGDKTNPALVTVDIFYNKLSSNNEGTYLFDFFYKNFNGFSPLISREICFLSSLNENTYVGELNEKEKQSLWNSFSSIVTKIKNNQYNYCVYYDENNEQTDYYCFYLNHLDSQNKVYYDDPATLLDEYYYQLDNRNKINNIFSSLIKNLNTKIDRNNKKIDKQRNELLNAENREKYKIYGELILSNLYEKPVDNKLTVLNYYDENQGSIFIPIDPKLNLAQNSQKYFKKYNKLKKAEEELAKLINTSLEENKYLENILYSIETSESLEDLDDIYNELSKEGLMKRKTNKKRNEEVKPKFIKFMSSGNHEILVGKNNLQNDMLTFKIGNKEDYWFHAKNLPGSHVIIKTNNDELTDQEFVEASQVAAYYSKGRNSSYVEVDYTKKINIKKPPNAKPGFVIYDTNYSMLVKPDISKLYAL